MSPRLSYYRYLATTFLLAICLDISRFFEFQLNEDKTEYWTTALSENPRYVQFNSYWNEILATGIIPLCLLCFMNWKIFRNIKASNSYGMKFVSFRKTNTKANSAGLGGSAATSRASSNCSVIYLLTFFDNDFL